MSLLLWIALGVGAYVAVAVFALALARIADRPHPRPYPRPKLVPDLIGDEDALGRSAAERGVHLPPDDESPPWHDDPRYTDADYWMGKAVRVPGEFSRPGNRYYEFGTVVDVYAYADGENGPSPDDEFAPLWKLRVELPVDFGGVRQTRGRNVLIEDAERC